MTMFVRILSCLLLIGGLQCCKLPQAQSKSKRAKAASFTATTSEGKKQSFGKKWRGTHLFVFFRGDW